MAEIDKIIVKFLNQEANHSDLDELECLLKTDEGIDTFNRLVKTHYLSTLSMTEFNVDKAKSSIKARVKKDKRFRKLIIIRKLAVAASISLILCLALYNSYISNKVDELEIKKQPHLIVTGSDRAILTLENGDEIALEKGKKFKNKKVSSNGEELIYKDKGQNDVVDKVESYNYLTIPRGGQFFVRLSDGSEIWLNSESKLKYPVEFTKNKTRTIELVYGEAYFKVSPSSNHNGAEFHVITKSQKVGVLGTEFNVRAYNDEDEIATTLVEGKVKVTKSKVFEILKPSQQSKIRSDSEIIDIEEVDVSQEISWIKGLFSFNEKPLEEIMTVLSRWYDTDIVFRNAKQKNFVFTGILERTETVEDILELIEATSEGQLSFEISNKTIIIK